MKNEAKVGAKAAKYIQKRDALEDFADQWITTLRKEKHPKRKTVKVGKGKNVLSKWGKGTQKVDEMEYKMWELEDLYRDANEEANKAKNLVCLWLSCRGKRPVGVLPCSGRLS